jgi:hypothetical protein
MELVQIYKRPFSPHIHIVAKVHYDYFKLIHEQRLSDEVGMISGHIMCYFYCCGFNVCMLWLSFKYQKFKYLGALISHCESW